MSHKHSVLHTFWLGRGRPCSKNLSHGGAIAVLRPCIVRIPACPHWVLVVARKPIGRAPAAILHMCIRVGSPVQPGRR